MVIRDLTDQAHPVTRCTFSTGWRFRFITATRVSYVAERWPNYGSAPGALYVVDLTTQTTSLVRAWENSGIYSHVYAWNPEGTMLTYVTDDHQGAPDSLQWHILSPAGDRTVATLSIGEDSCDITFEGPSRTFLAFSPDSRYVGFARPPWGPYRPEDSLPFQVRRVSDGKLVFSQSTTAPTFWLGNAANLFIQNHLSLQEWDPSGHLQDVVTDANHWRLINPVPGPDGKNVLFSDQSLDHSVGMFSPWSLDLSSRTNRQLAYKEGYGVSFLTPTLVWFAAIQHGGYCPDPTKPYVYDFADGTVTPSIITRFFDSWPHLPGQS